MYTTNKINETKFNIITMLAYTGKAICTLAYTDTKFGHLYYLAIVAY